MFHHQVTPERIDVEEPPPARNDTVPGNQPPRKNRPQKVVYFHPPFSLSVSTNVAKYFLNLIDKHFPENHKFRKLFNRNNLKVSYGCMPNVKSFVNGHNKKILKQESRNGTRRCNCPNGDTCPMDGNCLSENTLYSGRISSNLQNYVSKKYIGLSEPEWKKRFYNHTHSFTN